MSSLSICGLDEMLVAPFHVVIGERINSSC
jgi:hypothetical protein